MRPKSITRPRVKGPSRGGRSSRRPSLSIRRLRRQPGVGPGHPPGSRGARWMGRGPRPRARCIRRSCRARLSALKPTQPISAERPSVRSDRNYRRSEQSRGHRPDRGVDGCKPRHRYLERRPHPARASCHHRGLEAARRGFEAGMPARGQSRHQSIVSATSRGDVPWSFGHLLHQKPVEQFDGVAGPRSPSSIIRL